jgi:hypothetical protein
MIANPPKYMNVNQKFKPSPSKDLFLSTGLGGK